jgi:hypothetical protein
MRMLLPRKKGFKVLGFKVSMLQTRKNIHERTPALPIRVVTGQYRRLAAMTNGPQLEALKLRNLEL